MFTNLLLEGMDNKTGSGKYQLHQIKCLKVEKINIELSNAFLQLKNTLALS
jgi:hypothetical protein